MGWVVNATSRPLYPRERPGTHCIGGLVGPRAGLDGCGKAHHHHRVFTCDKREENKVIAYGMWTNGGGNLIHVSTEHGVLYDQGHWRHKSQTFALFYRLESTCLLSMVTACKTAWCPDQKVHNPYLKVFCRCEQDLSISKFRIPWAFHIILHS